jgi:multicomponent Na+:H+ antiporter subunit D
MNKKVMKWGTFIIYSVLFIASLWHLFYVHRVGMYSLNFGNHPDTLGIEFKIDHLNSLLMAFISGFAWVINLYSIGYLNKNFIQKQIPEYYGLFAMLFFGMAGLLYTNDLFNMYVFIEILSLTTVALISVSRKKRNYMAAFRYLMLNAVGSISFLMGVALLYMVTGALNIDLVGMRLESSLAMYPMNAYLGLAFMGIGLAIKAAIFPFHVWLPDAYASAPTPTVAILSSWMGKLYLLVIAKLLFNVFNPTIWSDLNIQTIMMGFAITALIMGSLFALAQKDIKRMLAYSSISSVGYILLALSLMSLAGLEAMIVFIISHAFLKGIMFLIAGTVKYETGIRNISEYKGMAYLMPFHMTLFAFAAFGMIGIPLTSGFVSKWILSLAVLESGFGILVFIIILASLLKAIYFIPVVVNSFLSSEKMHMKFEKVPLSMLVAILILFIGMVSFGIFPNLFIPWIEAAALSLSGF